MPEPIFKRVLLKLSGEALAANQGFGVDPAAHSRDRRRTGRSPLARRADCDRRRRRKFLSRRCRTGAQHGPRLRRPYGHAGHCHQRARAAGRTRKTKYLHPRANRARDEPGGRAFHSAPRHAPSGKAAHRDLRRRHRQSVFFDRHRRLASRHGDQRPTPFSKPPRSTAFTTPIP